MLGRYRQGGCRPCTEPGPDCSGHERDTRRQKRAEQRQVQREVAAAIPESMLQQVAFDDEPDDRPLRVVRLVPVDEAEDVW
jgi:hypothetical protein